MRTSFRLNKHFIFVAVEVALALEVAAAAAATDAANLKVSYNLID